MSYDRMLKKVFSRLPLSPRPLSWQVSAIPIALLLAGFIAIIIFAGAAAIADNAPAVLLAASAVALSIAWPLGAVSRRGMAVGLRRSASQILPAVPILLCIAALATTWMMAGIVPMLVDIGLRTLSPQWFLATVCVVCAIVSVLTGSSWTTVATVGVAFIGMGEMMGHSAAWTAGAVISGAYFGDKVSPLSDTTVVASSTCGVEIMAHIRYMMITTVPAIAIAIAVFTLRGFMADLSAAEAPSALLSTLESAYNLSPWVLLVPLATILMIVLRVNTLVTLGVSALLGFVTALVMQPQVAGSFSGALMPVLTGFESATGDAAVDRLASTGGILGIIPVIKLILAAMLFGWVMIGTGMLGSFTGAVTSRLRRRTSIVGASVASGLTLNACTADQYLSIIIGGNMYRHLYRRHRLEARLLSRSLEDSVSATSPLIPWSSCGVTQAAVLGVGTVAYLPYCIFNYLTPLIAMLIAAIGFRIRPRRP